MRIDVDNTPLQTTASVAQITKDSPFYLHRAVRPSLRAKGVGETTTTTTTTTTAVGANLLGAMVGGALEYLALILGFNARSSSWLPATASPCSSGARTWFRPAPNPVRRRAAQPRWR